MIRKVLAWMLMALLPLQGYAAASMISCGPTHAHMAGAHVHEHGDEAAHGHGHHKPASQEEEGTSSGSAGLLTFTCSACAACCTVAAAPLPAFVAAGRHAAHGIVIPFVESADGSITLDRLDRPPRTVLA